MSFLKGLNAHLVVIGALILRETRTRFGANYLGYLWAFLEPILWIGTFFILFAFVGRVVPYRMDIVTFITTGLLPFIMFRQNVERMQGAITGNKSLLFYPQVQIIDLIMGRFMLELGTLFSVFWIIIAAHAFYTGDYTIGSPLKVIFGLFTAGLMGSGIGLCISMFVLYWNTVERLMGIIMRPLFFISGIFFTADSIPISILQYLQYNPIFQLIELMRDGFFVSYESPILDYVYIFEWTLMPWLLGLTLERMSRHRLELT